MRYLLLTALLLTNCQPADIDPSLDKVVTVPSPTPEPTLEPTPTVMPTFCIPRADVLAIDPEDPDNLNVFFWEYDTSLDDMEIIINQSMLDQGIDDYFLTREYRSRWSVTGIVINVTNLDYDGACR